MINLYLLCGVGEAGFVNLWIIAYAVMLLWGRASGGRGPRHGDRTW
jgi:hypothetical protein